jgi:hypothetical protein
MQHRYDGKTADNGKEIETPNGHTAKSSPQLVQLFHVYAVLSRRNDEYNIVFFLTCILSQFCLQFSRLLKTSQHIIP